MIRNVIRGAALLALMALGACEKQLTVNNAFLCCMLNRAPMPTYVPGDASQPGCTINNPATMSIWAELIGS